ncbi:SIS domain-containing protein [Paenibacillus frigoriresistens]|uniref:SIS domain-containing protein n=1 Tax=Paenibacillus alginolyticus TaxID=59839 RepID=UPI001563B8B4|nr:SIS domain-containing protein [Paenibacillus frigoriresistens]NRF92435.1 SIS domain-containing protein [Paenibacillus frigoriresistens]
MSKFWNEVLEQPDALLRTLDANRESRILLDETAKPILFTGMGGSLAAAQLASLYLNAKGIVSSAMDTSELLYYQSKILDNYQIILISQSGESIEAVKFLDTYSNIIGVTNTLGSSVALRSKQVFFTYAGKEESVAASKSFTSTLLLLLLLASRFANDDLEAELLDTIAILTKTIYAKEDFLPLIQLLHADEPLVLMGRGPSVTTADYGGLLLKETARMFTESLSVAQFRHGPFELVAEKFQCIFFNPPGPSYEANEAFAREIAEQGGQVVYISNRAITHPTVSSITLVDAFNEFTSPIIYVFFVQLIALEMSQRKGLVAGEAKLVGKVTGKE